MTGFGYNTLGFGTGVMPIVIDITANTSNYNILTQATAAGYNAAADTMPVIVNVASGVTVSASGTHAMRTGALNAASALTVNISGSIDGYTGATTSTIGAAGSVGGDALYWETNGTSVVNVLSGANLRSGGGGGGGGGNRGSGLPTFNDKTNQCSGTTVYGSHGSSGAAGGFGAAGANGSAGGHPAAAATGCGGGGNYTAGGTAPGTVGAGGAAGFALRKNSKTVTLNDSGTVAGSAA